MLIPIAPGTNRNDEMAQAFELAGAWAHQYPLEAIRRGERVYFERDRHWTARGHAIAAASLAERLPCSTGLNVRMSVG